MSDEHERQAQHFDALAKQAAALGRNNESNFWESQAEETRAQADFNRRFPAYLLGALIFIVAMLVVLWLA